MNTSVFASMGEWNVLGTIHSANFSGFPAITDMVDTTTKPVTDTDTGRFVADIDNAIGLVRMCGVGIENDDFSVRVYTWSTINFIGRGTSAPVWTPHYHGEVLCAIGVMAVSGSGQVGSQGPYIYADTMTIVNNSGFGDGIRIIGRDNGAGDGTVTPDGNPAVFAFDRLSDQLVEIQINRGTAEAARPIIKFASSI